GPPLDGVNEVDADEGDAHRGVDHDALVEDAVEHVDRRVPLDARSPWDAGSVPGARFLNRIGKLVAVWCLSIGTVGCALPNPRSASQFMASLMSSTVG